MEMIENNLNKCISKNEYFYTAVSVINKNFFTEMVFIMYVRIFSN